MTRPRLGVLISGRGSNLLAILRAIDAGELPATVALVVSNRAEAAGLDHAQSYGVPQTVVERTGGGTRSARHESIRERLVAARVDLVVCAGWDEILVPEFVATFPGRILNVHPSLLPAFAGTLHAQEEALAAGVKLTGCTVHFVTDQLDGGPIVVQRPVAVAEDDTLTALARRILHEEHRALVDAIALWCAGRLRLDGRRVKVSRPVFATSSVGL